MNKMGSVYVDFFFVIVCGLEEEKRRQSWIELPFETKDLTTHIYPPRDEDLYRIYEFYCFSLGFEKAVR